MKLSLVIPCYNEEQNVRPMLEACVSALADAVESYELIFVNDGSRDGTWKALKALCADAPCPVKVVNLSRNFGKEAAMYAGLKQAQGEYISLIDADLQQRPEVVVQMLTLLESDEELDCVAAYQDSRREGAFVTWCKKCFYGMMNKACEIDFHQGASDFRTFRRSVRDAVLEMGDYYRFSKGIFSWVGFNTAYIPYEAQQRNAGKTSWSFFKLVKYAIEGIVSFTTFPLKIATVVGAVSASLSLIYMLVVVIQKLAFGIDIPGYPTIIVLILLIGGLQMMMLGLAGEYIARIYTQGKHRPIYIARDVLSNRETEEK